MNHHAAETLVAPAWRWEGKWPLSQAKPAVVLGRPAESGADFLIAGKSLRIRRGFPVVVRYRIDRRIDCHSDRRSECRFDCRFDTIASALGFDTSVSDFP